MNAKICVMALLCHFLSSLAYAQALKVGDKIPDELWNLPLPVVNHPEGRDTIRLGEYKDKLIILDFWATWCGPCVKSLSKLDSIQKEFEEMLVIVPITYEERGKALAMFHKGRWSLPTVVGDTVLKGLFPHRSIPHLVWFLNGKILAITGREGASKEIVGAILEGKSIKMIMKEEDMQFDPLEMIKPSVNSIMESGLAKRVKLSGAGVQINRHGYIYFNTTVKYLFREAYSVDHPFLSAANRIIIETCDSSKFNFPPKPSTYEESLSYEKWKDDNLYTYYVKSAKPQTRNAFLRKMASDISSYFEQVENLVVSIEKRSTLCLVIKGKPQLDKVTPVSPSQLRKYLDVTSTIPVIDETGYPETSMQVNFKEVPSTFSELKNYLSLYGLDLVKEYRDIEMMIIKSKTSNTL